MSEIELTIVMPCLNEIETIETCVKKANRYCEQNEVQYEIVIGDNGSTDGSIQVAEKLGAKVIPVARRGYGSALQGAIANASGKYVIMGDSDDSYDFLHLSPILEQLRKGSDLVMGNRFRGGIEKGAMPWKNRYIGNPVLSFIGRLFFRLKIGDFHCGLRGFNLQAYKSWNLITTGMEFASEMVIKAHLKGAKIEEVPIKLYPDGRSRAPHLNPWRDGWRHLRFMLLYSPRWLFFYPGTFLFLIGAISFVTLSTGNFPVGNLTFGVNTLLLVTLLQIIGMLMIFFSQILFNISYAKGLTHDQEDIAIVNRILQFENAITVGVFFLIMGAFFLYEAVDTWKKLNYGQLNPETSIRQTALAFSSLFNGFIIILCGFISSAIQLQTQNYEKD